MGVFDGHSGAEAAQFAQEKLLKHVQVRVRVGEGKSGQVSVGEGLGYCRILFEANLSRDSQSFTVCMPSTRACLRRQFTLRPLSPRDKV